MSIIYNGIVTVNNRNSEFFTSSSSARMTAHFTRKERDYRYAARLKPSICIILELSLAATTAITQALFSVVCVRFPQVALQHVTDTSPPSVQYELRTIKTFLAEHLSKQLWGLFRLTLSELLCIISLCCFPNAAGT